MIGDVGMKGRLVQPFHPGAFFLYIRQSLGSSQTLPMSPTPPGRAASRFILTLWHTAVSSG
jgi:hypothetical protein